MPTGLVLEGGGMRGWYTCGVLTVLCENKIQFPTVYGISAGALNALPYLSRQLTREYAADFLKYTSDERFISVDNLERSGSIFNFDYLFGDLFQHVFPFDYPAFFQSKTELKIGATDLDSGQAVFFGKKEMDKNLTAVRASCSLPIISNIVSWKGHALLDGGCAMPIPAERSVFDGNERNIIVLTRDAGYCKRTRPEFPRAVLRVKYGDYPNFIETMIHRGETYNGELLVCSRLEKSGKAVLIRPSSPIVAGRYEKDPARLREIYEMGIRDCEERLPEIRKFTDGENA